MLQIIKKIFNFAGKKRELLKKAVLTAFVGAIFGALQFAALMIVLDAVIAKEYTVAVIFGALGIMLLSIIGRLICMYHSTNAETEVGYFMVAQKRIEIGDRLRYIPMGYFNKNSLGAITGVVTTTLGDVENSAARCLVTFWWIFKYVCTLSDAVYCGLAAGTVVTDRNCSIFVSNRNFHKKI